MLSLQEQENAQLSPDSFPSQRVGSGDETSPSINLAHCTFDLGTISLEWFSHSERLEKQGGTLVLESAYLYTRNRAQILCSVDTTHAEYQSNHITRYSHSDLVHLIPQGVAHKNSAPINKILTFLMLYTLVRIPWPLSRRIVSFSANFRSLIEALECIRCIIAACR